MDPPPTNRSGLSLHLVPQALLMPPTLQLNCWVVKNDPGQISQVTLMQTETVGALKKAIKEDNKPELDSLNAHSLRLWKVSIPIDGRPEHDPNHYDLDGKEPLLPLPLETYFTTNPPTDHLHIIVAPPRTVKRHSSPSIGPEFAKVRRVGSNTESTPSVQQVFVGRKWYIWGAIQNPNTARCYYVNLAKQDETQRCLDGMRSGDFMLLAGPRASGKTTRLFQLGLQLEKDGYKCLYIDLARTLARGPDFWNSFGLTVDFALDNAGLQPLPKTISSKAEFLAAFSANKWKEFKLVLLFDEFGELGSASVETRDDFLLAIRAIKNHKEGFAIRSVISAGVMSILRLRPSSRSSPFNAADRVISPNFTLEETKSLFLEFARDNSVTIDDDVIRDIWDLAGGHPGLVCLAGHTLWKRIGTFIDHKSNTIPYSKWLCFSDQLLIEEITVQDTFGSLQDSLRNPRATEAVNFLRSRFAGFLGIVQVAEGDVQLAQFLEEEGVLFNTSDRHYRMASPLMDGFIRRRVITALFPSAPPTSIPLSASNPNSLRVLDVLIASINVFDKELMRLARSRSHKISKRMVGGLRSTPVPRESVYNTELMRILSNWLSQLSGWTTTGQWHVQNVDGDHRYCDIVLQKGDNAPTILELLATGDTAFIQSHIERTSEYMALLSASEAWVVHFTCEDDYDPIWQSSDMLGKGVNVVHFFHDLDFTEVRMMACWKDDAGNEHHDRQWSSILTVM